jgi:NADPH2:quinone reductase
MAEGTHQVLEWIKAGKIHFDIEQVPLQDIENIWKRTDFGGKRIVVIP